MLGALRCCPPAWGVPRPPKKSAEHKSGAGTAAGGHGWAQGECSFLQHGPPRGCSLPSSPFFLKTEEFSAGAGAGELWGGDKPTEKQLPGAMRAKALPQDQPKSLVRLWSCEQSPLLAGTQPPCPARAPPGAQLGRGVPLPAPFLHPTLAGSAPRPPQLSAEVFSPSFFLLLLSPRQELALLPGPGWEAQPGQGRTRPSPPAPQSGTLQDTNGPKTPP